MKRPATPLLAAILLLAPFPSRALDAPPAAPASAPDPAADPLAATVAALDARVFAAYNRCDLDTFGQYFSPTVEFYHDTGGATFDRATVLANTRKYICGKVRRELVPATLRVYPIKDFGAIEEGEHRFCAQATGRCEGVARFVIVWRAPGAGGGDWQITRVLSYGHRALAADAPPPVPSSVPATAPAGTRPDPTPR